MLNIFLMMPGTKSISMCCCFDSNSRVISFLSACVRRFSTTIRVRATASPDRHTSLSSLRYTFDRSISWFTSFSIASVCSTIASYPLVLLSSLSSFLIMLACPRITVSGVMNSCVMFLKKFCRVLLNLFSSFCWLARSREM